METISAEYDAAVSTTLGAIFFSMELSRSKWLVTALAPGVEKMSKYVVPAGDVAGLLTRLDEIRDKAKRRTGEAYPFISIQEAGTRWVLDTSRAAARGDRKPCGRSGFDRHVAAPTARQDRQT